MLNKKVSDYLEKNKYKYDEIGHKTTYTAWDTSQTERVKPQQVAKSLIIKANSDFILAVLSANRNLDKKKILKIINGQRKKGQKKLAKKVDFAGEVWMKKNILGKVGATPPFPKLLSLEGFVDGLLLKNKKIYVGSGDYKTSIRISPGQYLKIEELIKGSFSVAKK
jgi:prolyl-tRNA editing enzyme YbaK/EbsC (Cys-tRNA(Pro) deacylase)